MMITNHRKLICPVAAKVQKLYSTLKQITRETMLKYMYALHINFVPDAMAPVSHRRRYFLLLEWFPVSKLPFFSTDDI